MKIILIASLIIVSCKSVKKSESLGSDSFKDTINNSIVFLLLRITKDSIHNNHRVELVSKRLSSGNVKNQPPSNINAENYLIIYLYTKTALVDSIQIVHPLYKRVEYLNNTYTLSSKDIMLD